MQIRIGNNATTNYFSVSKQVGNHTTMVKESMNHFFMVCYSILFSIGVTGNLAVLVITVWRICVKKQKMTRYNLLIMSLAVADLIGSFFAPFIMIMTLGYFSWNRIGAIGCKMIPSMSLLGSLASAWNVVVIALSRLRYFIC